MKLGKIKDVIGTAVDAISANTSGFINTENFRGFKRIQLSTYGYEPVQKGISKLAKRNPMYSVSVRSLNPQEQNRLMGKKIYQKNFDLSGKRIHFIPGRSDSSHFIKVMIGQNHVGTFFKPDADDDDYMRIYKAILAGKVDMVHIEITGGKYKIIQSPGTDQCSFFKGEDNYETYLYVHFIS